MPSEDDVTRLAEAKLRRPVVRAGLATLLGVALLLLYLTPYLTLHRMQVAAAAQEGERLAQWVDFPALRESLKVGVQQRLAHARHNEQGQPTPASLMGAAVAGALLGPLVDTLITPASLMRVLQGQRPAESLLPRGASGPDAAPRRLETHGHYESLNRFVFSLRPQGDQEDPIELVLHRSGPLAWRLAELRLP
ncbi:DUF2939 domain-containing protein [Paucibacter sp. AS339]|uniref:DUF2939 domain-containing protein n=1 Tax=Paucibacter hankyongi TaxID=3133434 RepID=UPI003096955F